jgi:hypothetical protein
MGGRYGSIALRCSSTVSCARGFVSRTPKPKPKLVSIGKVALFSTSTIIGGLVQVWLLYVVLYALGRDHSLPILLGDGGLFFFTTSLTATSALVLFEKIPGKPSPWDLLFTVLIIATCAGASVYYMTIFTGVAHLELTGLPFKTHVRPQLTCAFAAFAYAFFALGRTGYFSR